MGSNQTPQLDSKPPITSTIDEVAISGYEDWAKLYATRAVLFHFDKETFYPYTQHSSIVMKAILRGMDILERITCVRFNKSDSEGMKVVFAGPNIADCYVLSNSNGPKRLNMGFKCIAPYTIFHELLHVLGLIHEQSRSDRDDYVLIRNVNAQTEKEDLKNIFPFSFTSVMLYRQGRNMQPRLKYRDVYWPKDAFMSRRDVATINTIFKCANLMPSPEFEKLVDRVGSSTNLLSKMNMLDQKLFSIPHLVFIGGFVNDWGSRWERQEQVFERNVRMFATRFADQLQK